MFSPFHDFGQHGSGTERNTKRLSNGRFQATLSVPRATNLKATQTSINFHFTEVMFTRRKPHPYEHFVLDFDAKVDF